MKPISLTIEAFGPFAGVVDIDFARLDEYGAFVIAGPTGAGKTTILDAIVFALYGVVPGRRKPDELRSHFAAPHAICSITFTFEIHGERYRVTRRPTQLRPKKTGEGMTEDDTKVVLEFVESGRPTVTRVTEANAVIAELLGLTSDQFQQVVLLPQGEFEKALRSSNDVRAAILTSLFPVVKTFQEIAQQFKLRATAVEGELAKAKQAASIHRAGVVEQLRPELDTYAVAVEVDLDQCERDAVVATVDQLAAHDRTLEARATQLEAAAKTASDAHRVATEQANLHDAALAADTVLAALGEEQVAHDERVVLAELTKNLGPLEAPFRTIEELRGRADEAAGAIEEAALAIADRVDHLPPALAEQVNAAVTVEEIEAAKAALVVATKANREAVALQARLTTQRAALEQARAKAEEAEQSVARAEQDVAAMDATLAEATGDAEVAAAERATLGAAETTLATLTAKLEAARSAAELVGEREEIDARALEAQSALEAAKDALAIARAAFVTSRAAELAATLEDGCPCPVCGGVEHPNPATLGDDASSAEEIQALERGVDAAESTVRFLAERRAAVEGQLLGLGATESVEELKAAIEAAEAVSARVAVLDALLERARAVGVEQQSAREAAAAAIGAGKARLADAALELAKAPALELATEAFESSFGPLGGVEDQTEVNDLLRDTLDDYRSNYTTWETLESEISKQTESLLKLAAPFGIEDLESLAGSFLEPEVLREIATQVDAFVEATKEAHAAIAAAVAAGVRDVRPDLVSTAAVEGAATEAATDARKTVTALATTVGTIRQRVATWDEALDELAEVSRRAGLVVDLAQQLAGTSTGGAVKVALRDWVLSSYLATIVDHANARLEVMSSGRYSLDLGADSKGSRTTLDLVVADANTGRSRPVDTLSGGETFLAAISLALGLADVVTSSNGSGLEALFIDEGFGTLDEDRLDVVLGVLDGLQGGGRTVGVISHVEELKRALPTGISVSPGDHGSTVVVSYPGGDDA